MRVYVVESTAAQDAPRRVLDVYQSTESARDQHRSADWARNDFDEWASDKLQMKITPHESKG